MYNGNNGTEAQLREQRNANENNTFEHNKSNNNKSTRKKAWSKQSGKKSHKNINLKMIKCIPFSWMHLVGFVIVPLSLSLSPSLPPSMFAVIYPHCALCA